MARERRKVREGRVVSDKMDKTVVVAVESRKPHPLYRRIVKSTKKYMAHNEGNEAHLGDLVRIEESRPYSKRKQWRVAAIIARREVAEIQPREIGIGQGQGA
ncbi:MAG: 30S ribosomal protein S17 [Chloroflexi bacterium]|nr:30S ribosomal protein S17 [Chloroflexota bacterium]